MNNFAQELKNIKNNLSMRKKRLTIKELEMMTQTKYLVTSEVCGIVDEAFGDDKPHNLVFDIFDGFAYCHNYKGKEYTMSFPREILIKDAKGMQKNIREALNLSDEEAIVAQNILAVYFQLKANINS